MLIEMRKWLALAATAARSCFGRVRSPSGAMCVAADNRATGVFGENLASLLFDEARIAVMPGESFGAATAGHLRIALTMQDAELAHVLARLIAFAEATLP